MRISGENLGVFRGGRLVFRHLDVLVEAGGALVLTGPNGAGKTTLLRLLAGLIRPDAGTLRFGGIDMLADPVAHARAVAFLGHQDAIKPGLTPVENLWFQAAIAGRSAGDVLDALDEVGLATMAGLPARLLSAGQKRRLALARIRLSRGAVLLLDEPATGLDEASLGRLGGMLAGHRAAGGTVVVSTHVGLPLTGAAGLALGRGGSELAEQ